MVKYLLISFIIHCFLFLNIKKYETLGNPNLLLKTSIPISYNIISAEQRIDNMLKVKGTKENEIETSKNIQEKQEKTETKEEINKKTNKIDPEIKSKMSNNKKKTETKKHQDKKNINKSTSKKKNLEKDPQKEDSDNTFTKNGNFIANSDGTYTAISSKGINFKIINQIDPNYPRQAEIIRYNKSVIIEARFLVDLNGNIENIEILKSHEKFGFDKEVLSALKKWKFKPIVYNGRKIKVYFNKEFVFNPKS